MKIKFGSLIAVAFGLGFALNASAAAIVSNTPIKTTDCAVLGDSATLNLSKNVTGAYSCDEGTNTIKVATCHSSGSRLAREGVCAGTPNETDATKTDWNYSGCAKDGDKVSLPPDYKGFYATTKGGSVVDKQLGGVCSDATIGAFVN